MADVNAYNLEYFLMVSATVKIHSHNWMVNVFAGRINFYQMNLVMIANIFVRHVLKKPTIVII